MRSFRYAALSIASVAALAACGSSSSSSSASSAAGAVGSATTVAAAGGATTAAGAAAAGDTITIKNFTFTAVKAAPGATVKIKNDDTAKHTVTADDKSFDVSVGAGASGTLTAPAKAGSYAFHCTIHSSMKGTLVVEG